MGRPLLVGNIGSSIQAVIDFRVPSIISKRTGLRVTLNDRDTFLRLACRTDVGEFEFHEVTVAALAVDGKVEQREVAYLVRDLAPNADRPDML